MNPKGGKIMNKKYENKRNGNIATLIAENEKCKTATLEYEDGKTTVVTTSTLKRWWKEVENKSVPIPDTEDPDCGKKHWGNEEKEKAGDGTPYKRVIKRIILDEDQYVKEVMEQKKELGIEVPPIDPTKVEIVSTTHSWSKEQREAIYKDLLDIIVSCEGISYKLYDRMPNFILVKKGKKSIFELRVGRQDITVHCRPTDVPEGVETKHVNNYYMSEKFKLGINYAVVINALVQSFI